ncbi:MAG: ABC-2 family transporter protein [Dehalococcoidales bacterium]|nr:ABC-2 family transporter protein [Dehalococcoidales bacterium]
MKAYFSILKLRFAVQLQYRAAAAAGLFTQFFFGFVRVMVFHAFYLFNTTIQPMSLEQTVTYTWLGQMVFRTLPLGGDSEVLGLIRSGNFAYELCRPLNLYFFWYCRLISKVAVSLILNGLPLLFIVCFLPQSYGLIAPSTASSVVSFSVSLVGALLLGCAVANIISISTLWTLSGDGVQRLLPALVMIFSGNIVPLAFFPEWAQPALRYLPFSGLMDIPFRLYLGTLPPAQVFTLLTLQLTCAGVFIGLGLWLLSSATKRAVVQGG